MQYLNWPPGGHPNHFFSSARKVFTEATVQPSMAVLYYADEILRRAPSHSAVPYVKIELVATNERWSVYCLNYKAVLAVSTVDDETLDLADLDKNQLLQHDIPLPKPA